MGNLMSDDDAGLPRAVILFDGLGYQLRADTFVQPWMLEQLLSSLPLLRYPLQHTSHEL